jgi:hypothetical protein
MQLFDNQMIWRLNCRGTRYEHAKGNGQTLKGVSLATEAVTVFGLLGAEGGRVSRA